MGMTGNRSVIASDIEDDAVTTAKILDDAVTTGKILDANVTTDKMDYSADETPVNAVAATGIITMAGIAVADETFVIGSQTFTWKASRSVAGEVTIGADAPAAVTNLVTAITADISDVTAADGAGDTVDLTAATKGVAGNAIVLTEASTNMTVDGSGTLGGAVAGVDGTVGTINQVAQDGSYLYVSIAVNTISDNNWRRVSLGSVY